jgi:hypothetical protein
MPPPPLRAKGRPLSLKSCNEIFRQNVAAQRRTDRPAATVVATVVTRIIRPTTDEGRFGITYMAFSGRRVGRAFLSYPRGAGPLQRRVRWRPASP